MPKRKRGVVNYDQMIAVKVGADVREKLRRMAYKQGHSSISRVVRLAIENYLQSAGANSQPSSLTLNEDVLKQLVRITNDLLQVCSGLNKKLDVKSASLLIPIVDDFTRVLKGKERPRQISVL